MKHLFYVLILQISTLRIWASPDCGIPNDPDTGGGGPCQNPDGQSNQLIESSKKSNHGNLPLSAITNKTSAGKTYIFPLLMMFFLGLLSFSLGDALPVANSMGSPASVYSEGVSTSAKNGIDLNMNSGNYTHTIKDLQQDNAIGFRGLAFTRMATTRYRAASPTPFGGGGNWKNNWQYKVYRGAANSAGQETIVIDFPTGAHGEYSKPSATAAYLYEYRPSSSERIEQSTTDTNKYTLWYADGSNAVIMRSGTVGGADEVFKVTQVSDAYALAYNLVYDSQNRLTRVTDPSGAYIQLTYANVGLAFDSIDVTFSFTVPSGTTATTVALIGDFNDWNGTANLMNNQAGTNIWTITRPLEKGTWSYKFLVNNTTWFADPNNSQTNPSSGDSLINVGTTNVEDVSTAAQNVVFEISGAATTMSVVGSFNGWNTTANPMTWDAVSGKWKATISLATGDHTYKFLKNGSIWLTDPANPFTVTDPSGNVNSKIKVGLCSEKLVRAEIFPAGSSTASNTVDYVYDLFATSNATVFATLLQAKYKNDPASSSYTYSAGTSSIARPRLVSTIEPRHSSPMLRKTLIEYDNSGSFEGIFKKLSHPDTGLVHAELIYISDVSRKVVYANGLQETISAPPRDSNGNATGLFDTATSNAGSASASTRYSNGFGMVQSTTNALGAITSYQRTYEFGRITRTDLPDGRYTQYTYTDNNKPFFIASFRDADGLVTSYTRDPATNRVTRIDYPDGTYETFTYAAKNRIASARSRDGVMTYNTFNAYGIKTATRKGSTTSTVGLTNFTYYPNGKFNTITKPAINGVGRPMITYTYDVAGRTTRIDYKDNAGAIVSYETFTFTNGDLTSYRDTRGFTTTSTYDAYGRKWVVTDALNRATTYEYGLQAGCSSCLANALPNKITKPDGCITVNLYNLDNTLYSTTTAFDTPAARTTTYSYDALGRQYTSTNYLGVVTTYNYDPMSGFLTSEVIGAPFNYTTSYTRNTQGWLTHVINPNGTKVETTYDAYGRKTGTIYREVNNTIANQTSQTYNALGQILTSKDGNNNTTTFAYDTYGRVTTRTRANGNSSTVTYDDAGQVSSTNDYLGATSTFSRDIYGRMVYNTTQGYQERYVYEAAKGGMLLTKRITDPSGYNQISSDTFAYDAIGRKTSQNIQGVLTTYSYVDSTHTTTTTTGGKATSITRDCAGRTVSTKDGLNRVTNYVYSVNAANKTVSSTSTNPAGQSTITIIDGLGRTVSVTDALNNTTSYAYDGLNRMTSYTNDLNRTFSFEYNAAGQRTKRTEPDNTYQSYTYDLAGNMIQHRKADGSIATITYTNLNKPDYKSWSGSTEYTDWTYDWIGRLVTIENQDVKTDYTFEGNYSGVANELITSEVSLYKATGNVTRAAYNTYDAYKRLITKGYGDNSSSPSMFLSYIYDDQYPYSQDKRGRIVGINNDGPPPLAQYSYDSSGFISTIALENGLTTSITRDNANEITSYMTKQGSTNKAGVTHGYDAASRRTWAQYEDNLGQAYGYDAIGQVTNAKVNITSPSTANAGSSPTHSYAYDDLGNRNSSLAFGATTNYTSNSVNAYTLVNSQTVIHDTNGNMTSGNLGGAATSLTYDKENRLRSTTIAGVTTSYVYDANGRLTSRTEGATQELLTWSSWTLLAREVFSNNALTETFRYTWGLDLSGSLEGAGGVAGLLCVERNTPSASTWDARYPHYDANGNIIALTNATGVVSAKYRYDAFGNQILSQDLDSTGWNSKNIHGFSTKPQWANTKLHYYGYRWYDASNGRWINRDPIEEQGGLNMYAMVKNDAVDLWDVLGLKDDCGCKADGSGPIEKVTDDKGKKCCPDDLGNGGKDNQEKLCNVGGDPNEGGGGGGGGGGGKAQLRDCLDKAAQEYINCTNKCNKIAWGIGLQGIAIGGAITASGAGAPLGIGWAIYSGLKAGAVRYLCADSCGDTWKQKNNSCWNNFGN